VHSPCHPLGSSLACPPACVNVFYDGQPPRTAVTKRKDIRRGMRLRLFLVHSSFMPSVITSISFAMCRFPYMGCFVSISSRLNPAASWPSTRSYLCPDEMLCAADSQDCLGEAQK